MKESTKPNLSLFADSSSPFLRRGAAALSSATSKLSERDPFAGAQIRARRALGQPEEALALLTYWRSRSRGSLAGEMRYRWELSHQHLPLPPHAEQIAAWQAWRAADKPFLVDDPYAFESRLSIPVALTENCEMLAEHAHLPLAAELLAEAAPALRRDFAGFVKAIRPWDDTFALWCLVRRPHTLALLHPLAIAISACYAALVDREQSAVLGLRFPFHQRPLVSATAHLATALVALGSDLYLVPPLVDFVRSQANPAGGWGDDNGPPDILTTLVAVDLLSHVDPSFDPDQSRAFFESQQSEDGLWRALGPEAPWLTVEVLTWFSTISRSFPERFRWPYLPRANRDHKTDLPFYAYFADLARLFGALPGLARSHTELAFIDLAGFRVFNNRYGQDMGDDVLHAFAAALQSVPASQAIRDGGDEFLVVGAPGREGLTEDLEHFRFQWPIRFQEAFGTDVPTVAPRILILRTLGGELKPARERLGREITGLKHKSETPKAEGVLFTLDAESK